MRILYFHQHFTTPDGTGGLRSYEFARALIASGHQVTMVCGRSERSVLQLAWDPRKRWHRGEVDGIDVIALPLPYFNRDTLARRVATFLRYAARSSRIALNGDYDLLFATSTPLTAALPGIVMKLAGRGRKFVFEVRDLWPELPRAMGMKNPVLLGGMGMLERAAYRAADACVGLSPGIVDGIQKHAPRGRKIVMIPNGCDLALFHPRNRAELDLPGVPAGVFVAGFIGAHGMANGLDAVLDAAAELLRRGRTDIHFVLIGDGKCKEALVDRAQREQLHTCHFFAPIKKMEVAKITASFSCGLQILADVPAFYYGTSPNKFFDYLSAGIPVLNNYPGWLAELINSHDCGVAVPPRSPAAFADGLIALAQNASRREEMGRNARRLAETKFARPQLTADFVNLIESFG